MPGPSLEVFPTAFGNVGIMLGHEGLLPEIARCLTLKGADLICWPCSWKSQQDYSLIATERVLENRVALVASNRLDSAVAGPSLVLRPPVAGVEVAHLSSILPLLAMVSWRVGRTIEWEGAKDQIVADPQASHLLSRPYRAPWKYPQV